jgi:hypothetical protein
MDTAVNSLDVIPKFAQHNGMSMRNYALSIQGRSTLSVPQGSGAINSVYSPIFRDFTVASSTNFESQNSPVNVSNQSFNLSNDSLPETIIRSLSDLLSITNCITELL